MVASDLDAETRAKVLRQVEFYFSDSNLPGDKFLLKCIEESDDGLVSLPLVCSFSRMRSNLGLKEHGPENVTSETTSAVADVLRQSTTLRLSEDGTKVGRVAKLKSPDEVLAAVNARSISANPLPWNITIDEVETFFKEHAKVNSVRLPRLAGGKAFSGYATIELSSEEEAQRVMGLKLVFKGADLEFEPRKSFDERQAVADQNGQRNGQVKRSGSSGRAGEDVEEDDDDYPRGLLVSFNLKKVSEAGEEEATEEAEEKDGEKPEGEKDVDPETQVAREDIKSTLDKFGKINFVDFSRGDASGYARFDKAEAVTTARASAVLTVEGGFIVKDHLLTLNAVEGEEEKEYWKKLREGQGKRRESGGRGDRGRGRGGRFGRGRGGGGRGRGRWDRNEERNNNGVAKGKHKRFNDDEDSRETKSARTD
ncbi:unnamed protein product [Calypogeia fissa]